MSPVVVVAARVAGVGLVGPLLLVALELALLPAVNHGLDAVVGDGCSAHVDDVELAPWRGGLSLEGVSVRAGDDAVLDVGRVDVAVFADAFFVGVFAARVDVAAPVVHLDGLGRCLAPLAQLSVLPVDRVNVDDGAVYVDDVALQALRVRASNLRNSERRPVARFADVDVSAIVAAKDLGTGTLGASVSVDPRADRASFDADVSVRHLALAGEPVDVATSLTSEDGRFHGSVRTLTPTTALRSERVAHVVDTATQLLR